MRFSDLKRIKEDAAVPEPVKPSRFGPLPRKERERPAAPAASRVSEEPAASAPPFIPAAPVHKAPPAPHAPARQEQTSALAQELQAHFPSYTPEPVKQPPAGSPRSRREAESLSRAPAVPFAELDAKARDVYARVLELSGTFLKSVDQPYTEKYEAILAACRVIIENLKPGSVLFSYTDYSTGEDYLRAHTANTTIIALAMGLETGLKESELLLLGFCAMAHDIGMTEYTSLYNRSDRLGEKEFQEMSLHAEAGVAKLDRIVDIDYRIKDRAKRIVLQIHERTDGTGYPDRLSDEEIDPLAQLISIADAYEALTHPRAWREAATHPDTVKELVEKEGKSFNAPAVKALLSAVSIYPPGSLVALSSGDIARVIRVKKGFLTKPLVEIIMDARFAQLPPRHLDLFEHPLTSIERSVSLKEIADRNPKFAARLEMARWWVEW